MTSVADPQLGNLLSAIQASASQADAASVGVPAQSTDEPAPGQPRLEWLAQVAQARAAADARAVRHRSMVDDASAELFGQTLAALLPRPGELIRVRASVPVAAQTELDELVPALAGLVPHGPGPRVPFPAGQERVPVTVTAPPHPTAAIVRLHGGAFWMGGGAVPEQIDRRFVDHLAVTCDAAVFDVDYRLAPEHPFPAAIIDVLSVLDAVRGGRAGIDVVPRATGLVGTSSGANTAVAAARADAARASSSAGPSSAGSSSAGSSLAALALVVPSVLLTDGRPDPQAQPELAATRDRQLRGYLGPAVPLSDPWISPALLSTLPGLPPTFAAIAQFDEIARGGERLCRAIVAGGGSAQWRRYPMTHTVAAPHIEAAFIIHVAEFLRWNLARH